ncbi:MAG: NfeD family protein [Thermoguttaceae bacterium]
MVSKAFRTALCRWMLAGLLAVAAAFCCRPPLALAAGEDAGAPRRTGHWIRIHPPINAETLQRVRRSVRRVLDKARSDGTRPVLIFEFDVPPKSKEFGRGSKFGTSYDLARFISGEELRAATDTVAFVPRTIEGHALLAILACEQIIMHPDAEIGNAGIDEKVIKPTYHSAYKEISATNRPGMVELALGMLDPSREVIEVQTKVGTVYVSPAGLEELREHEDIEAEKVLIPAGQPGQFSGPSARAMGLVDYLASDRREVADFEELPDSAIEEDPRGGGQWRTKRIDLRVPITPSVVGGIQKMIEDEIRANNVNFFCIWIESPGGSPTDSMQLANFLAGLDPGKTRTVAYIPKEARADAALIAMGCDQVVMYPRAVLGGPGAYQPSAEEIESMKKTIRESLVVDKFRSWSLIAALIDPNLEVFGCQRRGDVEYFCDEELAEQPEPSQWSKEERVTVAGKPLEVDGLQAKKYRLAKHVVKDFEEFKRQYDLTEDPTLVEPGWADTLIKVLASPGVAALLLLIGGTALYVELQMPGIGVGGFVATVCFVLFFWSNYMGETAGWLEGLLFLLGVSCLLMEVFVLPGFGIFGLGGGCLILLSLILASQFSMLPKNSYQYGQLQNSLFAVVAAGVGAIVVIWFLHRWLPRTPLLNRMFLDPPVGEEAEEISRRETLVDFEGDIVGSRGVTTTQLTPSGKARFGDRLLNVITDGDVVEAGTEIEVVETHGNRVIVRVANK